MACSNAEQPPTSPPGEPDAAHAEPGAEGLPAPRAEAVKDAAYAEPDAKGLPLRLAEAGEDATVALRGDGVEVSPGGRFAAVSVGSAHVCALGSDGAVVCWGRDDAGQATPPGGVFAAVSAGGAHSCGMRVGGSVVCWGDDTAGRADAPVGVFTRIAAGDAHTCGVRGDGSVVCWGGATGGFAGPGGDFVSLAAGREESCGVRAGGALVCWDASGAALEAPDGDFRSVSRVGGGWCALRADETPMCWAAAGSGAGPGGDFVSLVEGVWQSCGVRAGGALVCWDASGVALEAPDGDFLSVRSEGARWCAQRAGRRWVCWTAGGERPGERFVAIGGGMGHACGLRPTGAVDCWGDNTYGQADAPRGEFAALAAGGHSTCGLRADGDIACWGRDDEHLLAAPPVRLRAVAAVADFTCGLRVLNDWMTCWGRPVAGFPDEARRQLGTIAAAGHLICGQDTLRGRGYWGGGLLPDGPQVCWGPDGRFESFSIEGSIFVFSGEDICELSVSSLDMDCWLSAGTKPVIIDPAPPGPFLGVAVGEGIACGIGVKGGRVACWGTDGVELATPPGRFDAVAAGAFACGIRAEGTVVCWGSDGVERPTPRGRFEAVAVGAGIACGIGVEGGRVACWDADGVSAEAPSGRFDAVTVGDVHACALRAGAATASCWLPASHRPAPPGVHRPAHKATREPSDTFTAVDAGWDYSCAVRSDESMTCWGHNARPYHGLALSASGPFTAVSVGGAHACGLRTDATVECWGKNDLQQLRKSRTTKSEGRGLTTTDLDPLDVVAASAGGWHTCALRAGGSVTCWGLSDLAVSGAEFFDVILEYTCHSDMPPHDFEPANCWEGSEEDPDGVFVAISAGAVHTCGLRADASVDCWGHGAGGSVDISFDRDLDHGVSGSYLCQIMLGDSPLDCDTYGDVGQADAPAGRFAAVSAGGWHTCALRFEGAISCWGHNTHGQTDTPDGHFTAVSAGWAHTCALRADASVRCWGDNTHGQTDAPDGHFTAVTAGGVHTCALTGDASIVCWGNPGDIKPPPGVAWIT